MSGSAGGVWLLLRWMLVVVMSDGGDDGGSCVVVVGSSRWLIAVLGGVICSGSWYRISSGSGQCLYIIVIVDDE